MRIAFVTTEYVTEPLFDGGLSQYTHRAALALKKLGHEPVVFVSAEKSQSFVHCGIEIHRVARKLPHEFFSVPTQFLKRVFRKICWELLRPIYNNRERRTSRQIREAILREHTKKPFDIIHYTSNESTALCRVETIPAIVRVSSWGPLWAKAYEGNYGDRFAALEKEALLKADAIFGPSRVVADAIEKEIGRKVEIIETPFFIEECSADFSIVKKYNLDEKKYLLFFGTLGLMKGCLTIAGMLERFLCDYSDWHFVFAGKYGQKFYNYKGKSFDAILRESVSPENRKRLVFTNSIPHSQLYPVIECAQGIVLPSRIDNFPNTALEAMGHRKIVIGTRGASFEQLITDGENGFLCKIDDSESLFIAIQRFMRLSTEKKQEMEQRAWERIQELHPNVAIPNLVEFYIRSITAFSNKCFLL